MTKILIVEDEDDIREVLVEVLEEEGFEVASASNGAEGLRMLDDCNPELVITDMLMPVMTGVEMIRQMRRAGSPFATMPVIVLSAYNAADQVADALAAGACRYLTKPVEFDKLLSDILNLTSLDKERRRKGCRCTAIPATGGNFR